ncbi:MAG: Cupin domain protein [Firmicutes bacterium ADurb.Bin467]|jgi:mannose-6-phosphate isomerase-like protein (cupin superfamily)|nr:MAG: Cupin domain protein [Firmicutes bacterium ADurb.Bin467]
MITRKTERATDRRENMRGGNGAALLTPVSKELPKNLRLFSEIRLAPGSSIGFHVHENETELFLFLKGKGRVMDDDREVFVEAGDSMATFSGHGHSVECVGSDELVLAAVIVRD